MGLYGAIVIDPAGPDPVAYDREHVIVLADWSFTHPHEILRIPGLAMTVVPVETDELQIAIAETYDLIVTPQGDTAFALIAEAIDRSGQVRATLAPRMGMIAPIPALSARPLLTMKDMGMGAMFHGAHGGNHGSMRMRDPASAPQVPLGPGVASLAPMPVDRLGDRPTGLEDANHRVLTCGRSTG